MAQILTQELVTRTRAGHPPAARGRPGRPRTTDLRAALNAILYVTRIGCAWRMLPHDFPSWNTVYAYFQRGQRAGVWEGLLEILREQIRERAGREPTPSAAIIDSQTAKMTENVFPFFFGLGGGCYIGLLIAVTVVTIFGKALVWGHGLRNSNTDWWIGNPGRSR